jgi:putative spermidine/putrescine transport system substrate-binding protein
MKQLATALSAAVLAATIQCAQAEEVVFACWGGNSQKNFETMILPEFAKRNNATVRYVPGASTYFISQLQAQRNAPEIDVACMDDGPQSVARELGVLGNITPETVPALKDVNADAIGKDGSGVGYGLLAMGIVYNEDALRKANVAPPQSWNDLADPRFKGRIALGTIANTPGLFTLVMLAKANGGGADNIEPGFSKMKDVVKNVYVFAKGTDMAQYFQQGEAWMAVWTNSEAARFAKASGLPLKFVYPTEGAPIVMPMLALVKNGPNPKLGAKLIDFLMSETAQRKFADMSRLGPVNTKVTLTAEQSEGMIYGDAVKKLTRLDWSVLNAHRSAWTDRWNREIER